MTTTPTAALAVDDALLRRIFEISAPGAGTATERLNTYSATDVHRICGELLALRANPARPQVPADVKAALNACRQAVSDWARAPDVAGYMRLAEEQAALRAAIAAQVAAAVEVAASVADKSARDYDRLSEGDYSDATKDAMRACADAGRNIAAAIRSTKP